MGWIWKRIVSLFGHKEGLPLHGKIALPLVLVGAQLVNPGFKDAALSFLNKTFSLGLSLDTPWWVGAALIAGGVLVYLIGEFRPPRESGRFVAIRHQSFQPLTTPLPKEALPQRM